MPVDKKTVRLQYRRRGSEACKTGSWVKEAVSAL